MNYYNAFDSTLFSQKNDVKIVFGPTGDKIGGLVRFGTNLKFWILVDEHIFGVWWLV